MFVGLGLLKPLPCFPFDIEINDSLNFGKNYLLSIWSHLSHIFEKLLFRLKNLVFRSKNLIFRFRELVFGLKYIVFCFENCFSSRQTNFLKYIKSKNLIFDQNSKFQRKTFWKTLFSVKKQDFNSSAGRLFPETTLSN